MSILVVEDERIIARDIENVLRQAGYIVPSVASSGEEAIALAGMVQPDLVLMDIVLRGEMDGIEAAGKIRSQYGIPVIYLTAYADQPILERARDTEPIGYVLKPFHDKELLANIEMTMHQYTAQRQRSEEALHTSEERFSSSFQFAPIGMFLMAQDGHILKVNQALCTILGYSNSELVGGKLSDFTCPEDTDENYDAMRRLLAGEIHTHQVEKRFIHKLGMDVLTSLNASLVRDHKGSPLYFIMQAQDITESKRAEDALRASEEKFRQLVTSAPDAVFGVDQNGKIMFANAEATKLLGYSYEEFIGKEVETLVPSAKQGGHFKQRMEFIANPHARPMGTGLEIAALRKDGNEVPVDINLGYFETDSDVLVIAFVRDITERKRAEDAIRVSEASLKKAEKLAHLGHWEYLLQNNELYWSDEIYRIFEIDPTQFKPSYPLFLDMIHPEDRDFVDNSYTSSVENRLPYSIDHRLLMLDGRVKYVHEQCETYYDEQNNPLRSIGTVQDITERKLAETRILALNRLYVTISQINKVIVHAKDEKTLFRGICNVAIEYGNYRLAWISKVEGLEARPIVSSGSEGDYLDLIRVDVQDTELGQGPTGTAIREGRCVTIQDVATDPRMAPWREEALQRGYRSTAAVPIHQNNRIIGALTVHAPVVNGFSPDDEDLLNQIGMDISFALDSIDAEKERKEAETAMRKRLKEITALYAIQHDRGLDLPADILCKRIIKHLEAGMQYPEIAVPVLKLDGKRYKNDAWHKGLSHRIHAPISYRGKIRGEVSVYYTEDKPFILPEEQNLLDAVAEGMRLWLERTQARDDLNRQMEQLRALRGIDQAIVSTMDLNSILELLADEVVLQLNTDAAAILLLDEEDESLTFAVGKGLHTDALQYSRVKIGEGLAGKAALEQRTIYERMSGWGTGVLGRALARENFVSYYGVPLIANERLRGVLEIFHRTTLSADYEWLNLMESLAKQAAIAIDKAQLFKELESSNQRLALAYDTTLEGWSRALDLRDKETEGHTRRVTEMTIQLSRKFGFTEEKILQIRRGALLHDIGKMGIPDAILLKPDKLTDNEWMTMRKHPEYAYELLLPIEFLRPSLDIPYCHHEKWDGSGYPRGLAREEIPLEARIFAVVDVWDALTSERPYRAAWSTKKTIEYIQSQSGTHFDPQVVDVFLEFVTDLASVNNDSVPSQ